MIDSRKLEKPFWASKRLLCFLLAAVMILTAGFISVKRITITADGHSQAITTTATLVDRILHEAGIHLDDKDEFRLSTPKLMDQTEIQVYRAVLVTLFVDGTERPLKTAKQTVGSQRLPPLGRRRRGNYRQRHSRRSRHRRRRPRYHSAWDSSLYSWVWRRYCGGHRRHDRGKYDRSLHGRLRRCPRVRTARYQRLYPAITGFILSARFVLRTGRFSFF